MKPAETHRGVRENKYATDSVRTSSTVQTVYLLNKILGFTDYA